MIRAWPYFLLTLVVCALYGNTLQHGFHYDDIPSILEKPWIRGLDKIPDFITNFTIRPVVILSFNINYAISEFEVWSYHLFNILAHLGVVFLIYQLARQLLKFLERTGYKAPAIWSPIPTMAALIFAVHPLNTQAVTYISSRSSILATFFFLATILLFFKGFEKHLDRTGTSETGEKIPSPFPYYVGSLLCLLLGGLSKEIVITLPAMLFLVHFYFVSGQTFRKWITTAYAPILLVGMPIVIFIVWRVFSEGGVLPTETTRFSGATYFLTQTFTIPFEYFRKMFFPINQSIDVNFPVRSDWSSPESYVGLITLAGFIVFLVCVSAKSRRAGFGLAWMIVTLLPTSSFVPLHDVAVEHRAYLPLVGFSLFGASVLCELGQAVAHYPKVLRTVRVLGLTILVCLGLLLVNRNAVWKDDVRLWTDARDKAPRLVRTYNNLGEAYDKRHEYDKAIAEFETALRLQPDYVFALNNLGNVYGKLNNFQKAIEYFSRVLELKSDYAPAHYNLARAYQAVGKPGEAFVHYHKAIVLVPHFEQAIYNYALLGLQLGRVDNAIQAFSKFIVLQPENVRGYFGLGNAYALKKDFVKAIDMFQQGISVDPTYILIQVNLATAQVQAGRVDDALSTFEGILKRSPGIAGVHKNLGMIYTRHKNDTAKAIHHFEESLRLDPNQPEAPIIRRVLSGLKEQQVSP